ncbi:MAG: hypothetical protein DMF68_01150 [Acidobacteria bacterium]|nr:MAG: hypothetical protein DMF68_01150 [Acidobacteriota bacterium]
MIFNASSKSYGRCAGPLKLKIFPKREQAYSLKRTMKIILCKGQFLGPMSGADETLVNYATQLHGAGHTVCVLLLYPYSPQDQYYLRLREAGISVQAIASNSSRTFLSTGRKIARRLLSALPSSEYLVREKARRLATTLASRYEQRCCDFLRQSCADVVHVMTPDPGGKVLISAAHAAGIPVVYQEVGIPYHPPNYESYYDQFTSVLPFCSQVAAVSPTIAQLCRESLPSFNKLSVMPVMTDDLRNGHPTRSISQSEIAIGFAGRIERLKGPMVLLEAFAAASRTHKGLWLIIAGSGGMKEQLVARARLLGVASRCEFTGVYTSSDGRQSFMRRLDIFALPSFTEGTPNSIIEAMSLGLPIVATNVGGIPDVVDSDAGILVSPEDSASLSQAIIRLAEDAELRQRMGRAARDRYEKLFSPEAVLPVLLKTYRGIAGKELSDSSLPSNEPGLHPWEQEVFQTV